MPDASRLAFTKEKSFTGRWQQRVFPIAARWSSLTMKKSVKGGSARGRQ